MSASIAGSLLDDQGRPPFGAPVTGQERLKYYERQFFLPDGRPNLEGRQREAQRLGEAAYQQTLARVALARRRGPGGPLGRGRGQRRRRAAGAADAQRVGGPAGAARRRSPRWNQRSKRRRHCYG